MAMIDEVDVLYSEAAIAQRVRELGAEIAARHPRGELVLLSVLKGSFIFAADLARAIPLPLRIDFLGLSSYGGKTETSGVVKITSDLSKPIEGSHVVIVEDIIDTGLTMAYLLDNLATRKPASVEICALLEKPVRAQVKVPIHYKGFVIPDHFVVGYGLDYDERYRNLPFVGVLKKSAVRAAGAA
ncbi:MAG TPA: hypoxanthine phosphoribosyltransferase [Myxococcales bacterium]|nr:hypoxanthine phosphoribosyltransferase [Myxococcales bacterium]